MEPEKGYVVGAVGPAAVAGYFFELVFNHKNDNEHTL